MHIIKLNAIDSTNSYLAKLVREEVVPNYTVVLTEQQLQGRGQRGSSWHSESNKNLTFSILVRSNKILATDQFYMNMAISLGLLRAVKKYVKSDFVIKWPNDILADKDKVAGILIENMLNGSFVKHAIIGIGLNVNQLVFPENLEHVTSLKLLSGQEIDRNGLLQTIIDEIKVKLDLVFSLQYETIRSAYMKCLYKYNVPAMFQDKAGNVFLGKIIDISREGKLCVQKENDSIEFFSFKEVKLLQKPN